NALVVSPIVVLVGTLIGCSQQNQGEAATAPAQTRPAELKWPRAVAEAFLKDMLSPGGERYREGLSNCTEVFKQRYNGQGVFFETPDLSGTKEHAATWLISTEELSPAGDEAIFNGVISSRREGTFSLRVTKEKEGEKEAGRWRVDYFSPRYQ